MNANIESLVAKVRLHLKFIEDGKFKCHTAEAISNLADIAELVSAEPKTKGQLTDEQKAAVHRLKTKWVMTSISCPKGEPDFEWVKDLAIVADIWLVENNEQAVDVFEQAVQETKEMVRKERAGEHISDDLSGFRMAGESRVFSNCNVCGIKLRTKDEDQMGMCERCAAE